MKLTPLQSIAFAIAIGAFALIVSLFWQSTATTNMPNTTLDSKLAYTPMVKPDSLILNDLFFQVNREKFTVEAYNLKTQKLVWSSQGEDKFIVPGAAFPIDISPEGNLWVANPGRKRLEQLDPETGRFIASWHPQENFGGCCNPVRFAAMANGKFVTMEKGTRQARIFAPSGEVVRTLTKQLSPSEYHYTLIHLSDTIYLIDFNSKTQKRQQWEVGVYE